MSDRAFETAVRSWLDAGSDATPPAAVDAVLLAVKTTPQERDLRIPRRFDRMPAYLRLIAAAAVLAVVGFGALAYTGGINPRPTESPPSPTSSPVAPTVSFTAAFTSPTFGYDARTPAGWHTAAGTLQGSAADLALGGHDGPNPYWDQFSPAGQPVGVGGLLATSTRVPDAMTEDDWITAYQAPQVEEMGRACIPERASWEDATIGGQPGGIYVGCQFAEAMVFLEGRVYVFYYVNMGAPQSIIETTGRELLEAFLGTVRLDPGRVAPPISARDTTGWISYTSAQYQTTISRPPDWTESPATRPWSLELDADLDPLSPAMDSFEDHTGNVRVSMWEISPESAASIGPTDDITAWAEAFCRATGNGPCDGAARRAYPMCQEYRDCHPATMVVFESDVQAFFGLDGGPVVVVVVWRPDNHSTTIDYGSSKQLLQLFLSTVNGGGNGGIWPLGYVPGASPVLVTQPPS